MTTYEKTKSNLHEVLQIPAGQADNFKTKSGKGIPVDVFDTHEYQHLVPEFDKDLLVSWATAKNMSMCVGEDLAMLLYGYHGTGKTSLVKQLFVATNRPLLRVQHTGGLEESDLLGQTLARGGETYFSPGPLAEAMRYGWGYLADEYDYGVPAVLGVYQPVLEGGDLFIKEAPPEWRRVERHPDFRFFATGNTNGAGDETGLYIGTSVGNAANYSRFSVTEEVKYLEAEQETQIVAKKAGIDADTARMMVDYARDIRDAFIKGRMSSTISPREIIQVGCIASARSDIQLALELAHTNRLSPSDQKMAKEFSQRIFTARTKAPKKAK